MSIVIHLRHHQGAFTIEVAINAPSGLMALFGPSGAGKTSIINIVAGLTRPDWARIVINGNTLINTDARIMVPPHRRRIGYVFQEPRLFPHLSVRSNLLYGRFFAPRRARRETFDHVVDLLGIAPLLDRRPGRLSGGEKSRVALGRAVLSSPRLLLMDEPLAALDENRRREILPYIERLRDGFGIPVLYVTHSLSEVAHLASTLALLEAGKLVAAAPPMDLFARMDLPLLVGRVDAGALIEGTVHAHDEGFGLTTLTLAGGTLRLPRLPLPVGHPARIRIEARNVSLFQEPPTRTSTMNVLPVRIAGFGTPMGHEIDVRLDCAGDILIARITRQSHVQLNLTTGQALYAAIKSVSFEKAAVGGFGR